MEDVTNRIIQSFGITEQKAYGSVKNGASIYHSEIGRYLTDIVKIYLSTA